MSKHKVTDTKSVSSASKTLTSASTAPKSKILAGSALSQTNVPAKVTSQKVASSAGSALSQKASQVKSSAKTGKISRTAARSAVMSVSKAGRKK
jgi:hypothetical protein